MASKRREIFKTKWFGLIIAAGIILLFLAIDSSTHFFKIIQLSSINISFYLKNFSNARYTQDGVKATKANPNLSEDIVILGIDNKTLSNYGRWPFDRSVHADFINSLSRISDASEREKFILFDIFFLEPDANPQNDLQLSHSIANAGNVFLETIYDTFISDEISSLQMKEKNKILIQRFGQITNISGNWQEVQAQADLLVPLESLNRVIAGYGHANYYNDPDDIIRKQPLLLKYSEELKEIPLDRLTVDYQIEEREFERLSWTDSQGFEHQIKYPLTEKYLRRLKKEIEQHSPPVARVAEDGNIQYSNIVRLYRDSFIPSVTLSMALRYYNITFEDVHVNFGKAITLTHIYDNTGKQTDIVIPIDKQGQMFINYMGARSSASMDGYHTFPVRSYATYAEKVPDENPENWPKTKALKDKLVLVGAFAEGMAQDEKPTPYGLMYGIEIHANALNTLLMQNFLCLVPLWLDYLLFTVLVFLLAFFTSRFSTIGSFIYFIILSMVIFLTSTIVFEHYNWIYDFSKTLFAMLLTLISILAYRAMTEEKDKKQIRETFGKYVSPQVVDQLVEFPPELGGVDKEISVLFSDIRGFTTLSENMTPQELVNHLNEYFTVMTDIIHEFNGTLDKYVGDEIMCFWGAPLPQVDHAVLSCHCALKQIKALAKLNASWPAHKRINIGIGINSGIMTVGNMGSPGRMNYTLMGDNVNLGARLEGTNKQYGTKILISEYTYALVKDYFVVRELDNIRVKGKNKPVLIYELIDSL